MILVKENHANMKLSKTTMGLGPEFQAGPLLFHCQTDLLRWHLTASFRFKKQDNRQESSSRNQTHEISQIDVLLGLLDGLFFFFDEF